MMNIPTLILSSVLALNCTTNSDKPLTRYVNPLLGTATLWEPEDLGYVRTWKERTWGAEVFPGSSLPNAMVQLSPVTQFRSGAGEMSAWYVFNAIGLYTYSPADPEYIVSVPLFDKVEFTLVNNTTFTIRKEGNGKKIRQIQYGNEPIDGWFIPTSS